MAQHYTGRKGEESGVLVGGLLELMNIIGGFRRQHHARNAFEVSLSSERHTRKICRGPNLVQEVIAIRKVLSVDDLRHCGPAAHSLRAFFCSLYRLNLRRWKSEGSALCYSGASSEGPTKWILVCDLIGKSSGRSGATLEPRNRLDPSLKVPSKPSSTDDEGWGV